MVANINDCIAFRRLIGLGRETGKAVGQRNVSAEADLVRRQVPGGDQRAVGRQVIIAQQTGLPVETVDVDIAGPPNRKRGCTIGEGVVIVIGIVGVRGVAGDIDRRGIKGTIPHNNERRTGIRQT